MASDVFTHSQILMVWKTVNESMSVLDLDMLVSKQIIDLKEKTQKIWMSAGNLPTCIRHLIIFIHIRGN